MKEVIVSQCTSFICATCKENKWELQIAHQSDSKTILVIRCSNPRCIETTKKHLNTSEDATIIHQEFNITGQGYDSMDLYPGNESMMN